MSHSRLLICVPRAIRWFHPVSYDWLIRSYCLLTICHTLSLIWSSTIVLQWLYLFIGLRRSTNYTGSCMKREYLSLSGRSSLPHCFLILVDVRLYFVLSCAYFEIQYLHHLECQLLYRQKILLKLSCLFKDPFDQIQWRY
jgi:hypothetical protein